MNNITKQVITELETIKAIASELADMSPRTQMEIVALCKEICLNVDKVLEKHDIDIETLFNYLNAIESELEEIRQLIDPQHLALIDERLEDLEASILTINESIGGINDTLSTHTSQIQGLQNNKQDVLTAGNNITIENNVISASGGDVHLYEHNLQLYRNTNSDHKRINFKIITNDNTPLTLSTTAQLLYANNFTSEFNSMLANGYYYTSDSTTKSLVYCAFTDGHDVGVYFASLTAGGSGYAWLTSGTFTDTIRQII